MEGREVIKDSTAAEKERQVNFFGLIKAGRESLPKNALPALLESLGMKAQVTELRSEQLPVAFQAAVRDTQRSGAEVIRLMGTMPDGSEVHALMVMTPARAVENLPSKKLLTNPESVVL